MLFKDVPIMGYFFDEDDLCQKVAEDQAITPWCARGFTAGFRPDEVVFEAVKRIPAESPDYDPAQSPRK